MSESMLTNTAARGKAFLLKIGDDAVPPQFSTVAGLRTCHELIEDGIVTITGKGIMLGSAQESRIRAKAIGGKPDLFEFAFETGDKMRGQFTVTRFEHCGFAHGEQTYSVTLRGEASGGNPDE